MKKVILNQVIFIAIIILIILASKHYEEHRGYEYLDFNNDFGIASKCNINDKGLFCKTKNGLVEVKQYRKR